jgi:phosphoribosylformylglycinamidine synthase
MTPYEVLLSESQERMLVVAIKGREEQVKAILAKWDLTAAVIGEVIEEPVYRVTEGSHVVAEFPGTRLVTDCPMYTPDAAESTEIIKLRATDVHAVSPRAEESDVMWTLEALLSSPTIASKTWIHRQYDSTVRANTIVGPGHADAAVVRLPGTTKGIALKTDCNGRYVYLSPRRGGQIAVAEAARNVACTGARPMAITNCLNFGNPKRPEVFFQFREAVHGMGDACRKLGTPVTGGNVSLYNENPFGAVFPTPTIGMVGLIADVGKAIGGAFRTPGEAIVLLGEPTDELGASEYLSHLHGMTAGDVPRCDLAREKALIDVLVTAVDRRLLTSAHDCSEGGLLVTLAESAMMDTDRPFGAEVDLSEWAHLSPRGLMFGEAQGRAVVSTAHVSELMALAAAHHLPAFVIGRIGELHGDLVVRVASSLWRRPIAGLASVYHNAIPSTMARAAFSVDDTAARAAAQES